VFIVNISPKMILLITRPNHLLQGEIFSWTISIFGNIYQESNF